MELFGVTITGQIGIGSILTLITALVGFATVYLQTRRNGRHLSNVKDQVTEINKAVNGIDPGQQTMVKNVQELHDQMKEDQE